jgi:hypothetical protein
VTLEGWIFMVGLRVFDIGALIVWLVWFFKLRDDEDDGGGDDFRRPRDDDAPEPGPRGGGPPGFVLPLPDSQPWPQRRRDHGGDRPPAARPVHRPVRAPAPPARRVPARHR